MRAKKLLSLILVPASLLLIFAGCTAKETKPNLLPFNLSLGDTYEKTQEAINVGELEDSQANDGYITGLKFLTNEEYITAVLGTSEGVYDVAIGLSFNADKKLYEFYCFFTVKSDKQTEVNDAIRAKYSQIAGQEEADPDGIALWKNEEYVIDYSCSNVLESFLGEDAQCVITIHSFVLDFE